MNKIVSFIDLTENSQMINACVGKYKKKLQPKSEYNNLTRVQKRRNQSGRIKLIKSIVAKKQQERDKQHLGAALCLMVATHSILEVSESLNNKPTQVKALPKAETTSTNSSSESSLNSNRSVVDAMTSGLPQAVDMAILMTMPKMWVALNMIQVVSGATESKATESKRTTVPLSSIHVDTYNGVDITNIGHTVKTIVKLEDGEHILKCSPNTASLSPIMSKLTGQYTSFVTPRITRATVPELSSDANEQLYLSRIIPFTPMAKLTTSASDRVHRELRANYVYVALLNILDVDTNEQNIGVSGNGVAIVDFDSTGQFIYRKSERPKLPSTEKKILEEYPIQLLMNARSKNNISLFRGITLKEVLDSYGQFKEIDMKAFIKTLKQSMKENGFKKTEITKYVAKLTKRIVHIDSFLGDAYASYKKSLYKSSELKAEWVSTSLFSNIWYKIPGKWTAHLVHVYFAGQNEKLYDIKDEVVCEKFEQAM